MILIDTSVWIRHLRTSDLQLVRYLKEQRACTCDVVVGELRLGAGVSEEFEQDLALIPRVPSPSSRDALAFVDRHRNAVRGSGIGWADAQIIVSAVSAGARLLTRDGPQRRVWTRLGFRLA